MSEDFLRATSYLICQTRNRHQSWTMAWMMRFSRPKKRHRLREIKTNNLSNIFLRSIMVPPNKIPLIGNEDDDGLVDVVVDSILALDADKIDLSKYTLHEETVVLVIQILGLVGNRGFAGLFSDEIDGDPGYVRSLAAFKRVGATKAAFCFAELLELYAKTDRRKSFIKRADEFAQTYADKLDALEGAFLDAEPEIISQLAKFIRDHRREFRTVQWSQPKLQV